MRTNMLTSITEGILCCITGRPLNVVGAIDSVESADGYEYVEVKPGRVLRVKHVMPVRTGEQLAEGCEGRPGRGVVHCRRRICIYRGGQVVIENLGDAVRSEILHCRNGSGDTGSTLEIELSDTHAAAQPGAPAESAAPVQPSTAVVQPGAAHVQPRAGTAPISAAPVHSSAATVQPNAAPMQSSTAPMQPSATTAQPSEAKRRRRRPKRTVTIDCKKHITSCKGTHSDVVLFFIHGVGGSLDIWKEQLDFFGKLGYEVVALDLAGHGASTAPKVGAAYTFYALREDMRAIFKRYAKKRNILIGHSYGVSFCTFLAHEYPDQVHKVVMINGGGPTALEPSLCSIFNLPSCVLHCLSPCLLWSFLKAAFARQGAKEKQLLRDGNAFKVTSFVLRAMMSGQYWPEGDEVYHAELTVPVLLLHGLHDRFVPIEEDQRMAEILLIAFLKIIDEGSHMVMMECPETVNTLLHEFLLWEPEVSAGETAENGQREESTK
ncbi:protein ABHD8 [Amblyraja radiata]|uniref:protein ABHD8 n=1 Tax=Amblyraja radiata TaxID=386614 RepID=UPI0014042638|nr:protein ABHD8 [Amblyraja radiata]